MNLVEEDLRKFECGGQQRKIKFVGVRERRVTVRERQTERNESMIEIRRVILIV